MIHQSLFMSIKNKKLRWLVIESWPDNEAASYWGNRLSESLFYMLQYPAGRILGYYCNHMANFWVTLMNKVGFSDIKMSTLTLQFFQNLQHHRGQKAWQMDLKQNFYEAIKWLSWEIDQGSILPNSKPRKVSFGPKSLL